MSGLTDWQKDFMQHIMRARAEQVERVNDWLISAGLAEPPVPIDPRERALHMRKNRNTGPGKPIQERRRH